MPSHRTYLALPSACVALLLSAPTLYAADSDANAGSSGGSGTGSTTLQEVVVTATRLNAERSEIETQTGASTYTISDLAITAMPGGSNVPLNQVLLQAPDVAQDSFGQLHVRGDHNDLQYRLNGIILPEGISVFSQTLDPRIIASLSLITGALPAEYGLRTAGIIDLTTKGGLLQPGGSVSLYGGSHDSFEPSAWYGGSSGNYSYFVSADYLSNDLGIDSPDGTSTPVHDRSEQFHGFGYFEDILGQSDRLALVLGVSNEQFQIPNVQGEQPAGIGGITGLGPCGNGSSFYAPPCQGSDNQVLLDNGQYAYLSNGLNESQHELAQYAIVSWQHSQGALNWQSSLSARYTSLDFEPDWVGDLLYNGIAQNAFKGDTALGWQTDSAYRAQRVRTRCARASIFSTTAPPVALPRQVLPIDALGDQTSDIPVAIINNGSQTQWIESVYLQDEWKALSVLTINYGLRYDHYNAYSSGRQLSPRINAVCQPVARHDAARGLLALLHAAAV